MRSFTLILMVALTALFIYAAPVGADTLDQKGKTLRADVTKLSGDTALAGLDIVEDGVKDDGEWRAATNAEKARYVKRLRSIKAGLLAPAPAPADPAPVAAKSEPQSAPSGASAGMEGIAACESGGDPSAVSPDGTYRGKYQFDQQTWQSVGGSGDPAAAPEAEQDRRAAALYAQRGSSPWPVCGG